MNKRKMPGNAHCKRNSWKRGNGACSMRGELKRYISKNKKRLNRKARYKKKLALQNAGYKRICRTLEKADYT